jgi:hypothetical protein
MAYAVHTRTCTYLLDDDGVCRWIVSQQGVVPGHVRQCVGAQFVACLDLSVEGGLSGELRQGARALFVRHADDNMVLLRTGDITRVDDRRQGTDPQPALAAAVAAPSADFRLPYRAKPPSFGVVRHTGEEQTITVNRGGVEAATQRNRRRDGDPT